MTPRLSFSDLFDLDFSELFDLDLFNGSAV